MFQTIMSIFPGLAVFERCLESELPAAAAIFLGITVSAILRYVFNRFLKDDKNHSAIRVQRSVKRQRKERIPTPVTIRNTAPQSNKRKGETIE